MKTIAEICKHHGRRSYFTDGTGAVGVYEGDRLMTVVWYERRKLPKRQVEWVAVGRRALRAGMCCQTV